MAKTKGTEQRIEEFAEDLGRLLGTARAKAEGWLGQRQNIAKQLAGIRDTSADLLQQLAGRGARVAAAVRRGRRRGRPPGKPRGRRKMSAKARKAISDAQKRRWAAQKAAEKKK
jgi:hypothetical protein